MNRAERRRQERAAQKAKTATYNFTKEQLDNAVKEGIKEKLAGGKRAGYTGCDQYSYGITSYPPSGGAYGSLLAEILC